MSEAIIGVMVRTTEIEVFRSIIVGHVFSQDFLRIDP